MGEGREECGQRGKGPLALAALKVELARSGRSRQGEEGAFLGWMGWRFALVVAEVVVCIKKMMRGTGG